MLYMGSFGHGSYGAVQGSTGHTLGDPNDESGPAPHPKIPTYEVVCWNPKATPSAPSLSHSPEHGLLGL